MFNTAGYRRGETRFGDNGRWRGVIKELTFIRRQKQLSCVITGQDCKESIGIPVHRLEFWVAQTRRGGYSSNFLISSSRGGMAT